MGKNGLNKVFVVGAGALGSNIAFQLLKMGFKVTVADGDVVEEKNLRLQPFYSKMDIGKPKVYALKKAFPEITPIYTYIDGSNVKEIIGDYEIIVDATDNLWSKYLLSWYSIEAGKRFISCGIRGKEGIIMKNVCVKCNVEFDDVEGCRETDSTLDTVFTVSSLCSSLVSGIDRKSEIYYYDGVYFGLMKFEPLKCSCEKRPFDMFLTPQSCELLGLKVLKADDVDFIDLSDVIALNCVNGLKAFKLALRLNNMGYKAHLVMNNLCSYTRSY